jgi:hypothetical protein
MTFRWGDRNKHDMMNWDEKWMRFDCDCDGEVTDNTVRWLCDECKIIVRCMNDRLQRDGWEMTAKNDERWLVNYWQSNVWWLWEDCERTVRWQWDDREMTVRWLWEDCMMTMRIMWESNVRKLWDECKMTMRWLWDDFEMTVRWLYDDYENNVRWL